MATSGTYTFTVWEGKTGLFSKGYVYADFAWSRQTISSKDATTTINWTISLRVSGTIETTYQGTERWAVKIDGQSYTGFIENNVGDKGSDYPSSAVQGSGTTVIKHNNDGTKSFNLKVDITWIGTGGQAETKTGSTTISLDRIPIAATLISAPNFSDESNPLIYYSCPTPDLIHSAQACIEFVGGLQHVPYRDIPKDESSYIFQLTDAERKKLIQGITEGSSRDIRFTIRTFVNNTYYTSTLIRTFSLINHEPTLEPVIEDLSQLVPSLTGDPSVLVRYISDASFKTNATARKDATLVSGYAINGTQLIDDGISSSGVFEAVESNKFKFSVTDSRGITTTKEIETAWVPYIKPTCSLTLHPLTLAGTLDVTYKGICFTGDFGAKTNSLTFELRVTKNGEPIIPAMPDTRDEYLLDNNGHLQWVTPGGEEDDWFPVLFQTPTYGENSYELVFPLDGLDIGNVDNPNTFTIQGIVYDEVMNARTEEATALSKPIFDWGKTDFQFNVPVYLKDTDIPLENLKDYVVLQGYIDDWFYREWHSGKVELFGTKEIDDIPCNAALGGWYRTAVQTSPTYPFTIFNPIVTVNYESDGFGALIWPTTQSDDTRPFDYYLIRPTSSAGITGKVTYHIIGDHGGQIA